MYDLSIILLVFLDKLWITLWIRCDHPLRYFLTKNLGVLEAPGCWIRVAHIQAYSRHRDLTEYAASSARQYSLFQTSARPPGGDQLCSQEMRRDHPPSWRASSRNRRHTDVRAPELPET